MLYMTVYRYFNIIASKITCYVFITIILNKKGLKAFGNFLDKFEMKYKPLKLLKQIQPQFSVKPLSKLQELKVTMPSLFIVLLH